MRPIPQVHRPNTGPTPSNASNTTGPTPSNASYTFQYHRYTAPYGKLCIVLYTFQCVQLTLELIIATAGNSSVKLSRQFGLFATMAMVAYVRCWSSDTTSTATDYVCIFVALLIAQLLYLAGWLIVVIAQLRERLGIRVFHTGRRKREVKNA